MSSSKAQIITQAAPQKLQRLNCFKGSKPGHFQEGLADTALEEFAGNYGLGSDVI
jgi:hypothetical protein